MSIDQSEASRDEDAILARLIRPDRGDLSPDVARAILQLRWDIEDVGRLGQLRTYREFDLIGPADRDELEAFHRVEAVINLMHAKARRSLGPVEAPPLRPTSQIHDYVIQAIEHTLKRPRMYAPNPAALEDSLWVLDQIREFIEAGDDPLSAYSQFLEDQGYGSARFTSRHPDATFDEVAQFWRRYQQSRSRIAETP